MYNSLASSQEQGSKGSTRLHMDMADAFNVMLHATDCEDGTPGYAVWDLFRAEDSDKIRAFLRKRFTPGSTAMNATANGQTQTPAEKAAALQLQAIAVHDPIHSQHFYLDLELRKELWEQYSVKSYRIYQRPGEGVFIPAGCAHQVCFLMKLLFIY
jgi:lysine-specific demethylase 3